MAQLTFSGDFYEQYGDLVTVLELVGANELESSQLANGVSYVISVAPAPNISFFGSDLNIEPSGPAFMDGTINNSVLGKWFSHNCSVCF